MSETPTYRFGPRNAGGALGLGRAQLGAAGLGLLLALVSLLGARQPLAAIGFLALGAALAFAPVHGRPLVGWLAPLGAQLGRRRGATAPLTRHELRGGRGIEPTRADRPIRWHLPGVGRLVIRAVDTSLGEVGVADPSGVGRSQSLTFRLDGPRFGLADPEAQARALASWGQLLGALARDSRQLARLQLTERVAPDDLSTQWRLLERLGPTSEPAARAIYAAELESLAGQVVRHEVLLTLTLGRAVRELAAKAVASECARLGELLAGAGFGARPLGAVELAGALRSMLDPETAGLLGVPLTDRLASGEIAPGAHAPRAWRAGWGLVRSDSGLHACFEASALPRLPVGPEWAWPLVLSEAPVARRSIALHLELARPERAIRRAERAVVANESDEALRARFGFRSGARHEQVHEAALAREAELATGFADARFALLVTVSATSETELATSCRALVAQAAQSHVELSRLYGRQAEALVATLPLGIVRFSGGWR